MTAPTVAVRRRTTWMLLGAGAVGAAALPVWQVGLGWPLSALAVTAAVLVGRAHANGGASDHGLAALSTTDGPDDPAPESLVDGRVAPPWRSPVDRAWRLSAAGAALVLVAVPAIRSAGWLTFLCVAAAVPLGSYALAGGRTWRQIVEGSVAILPGVVRGLGGAAIRPDPARPVGRGSDTNGGKGNDSGSNGGGRIVAGIAVGVVLLIVFGSLFRGADPAFAHLTDSWWSGISLAGILRAFLGFGLVTAAALGATHIVATHVVGSRRGAVEPPAAARTTLGTATWVIPLTMLDALFALFVWVQVTVLFAGDAYVLGEGGPDYAVYARGGFTQLMVVTALTLGVVAALALWAGRTTYLDLGLLRLLGGVLCGLTLVIVASALTRLDLYADAYGFTVPRLLAFAGEVWLGLIFVLVLVAGLRVRTTWFPRATVGAAVGVVLALVVINPEAVMARSVLERAGSPYPVDFVYLSGLSPDAIDELMRTPGEQCLSAPIAADLREPDPWYRINLAREHARRLLREHPLPHHCSIGGTHG